jgi:hypothetical protein
MIRETFHEQVLCPPRGSRDPLTGGFHASSVRLALFSRTLHISLFACSTPFQVRTMAESAVALASPGHPPRPGNLPRQVVALCCGMRRQHSAASPLLFSFGSSKSGLDI